MKETVISPPANTRRAKENSGAGKQFFSRGHEDAFFNAKGIQPKLNIGQSGDKYEQHADAMADKMTSKSAANTPAIQAKPENATDEKLDKKEKEQKVESALQRKPMFESEGEPEIQKKENSESSNEASPSIESRISSTKGSGSPLDNSTRSEMEGGFGNDFSGVRVHTGTEAQQMNKDLNAQAFTHGQDIYFDQGKYNPQSSSGKHLLAHELTHTVQQTGAVQKMIQKKDAGKADYKSNPPTMELPSLNVPGAKKQRGKEPDKWNILPIKLVKENFDKKTGAFIRSKALGGKTQAVVWDETVPDKVKKVADNLKEGNWKKGIESATGVYYLKHQLNHDYRLIGKLDTIKESAVNPSWNRKGKASIFQIDHARELQAGGKNDKDNLELLETSVNVKLGGIVKGSINEAIDDFVTEENKKDAPDTRLKDKGKLKTTFDISFGKVIFNKEPKGPADNSHYWTYTEITEGSHLNQFVPMEEDEILKAKGSDTNKMIYTSTVGGQEIKEDEILALNKGSAVTFAKPKWEKNIKTMSAGANVGSFDMTFSLYRDKAKKTFKIPILKMDGVDYGGGIPRSKKKGAGGLQEILIGMDLPGLSPITITEAEIMKGKGLVAKGIISSTLPVIKGVELDFAIEGNDIEISKTFSMEDIKVPKPFNINDVSLTIFGGTKGFGVKGDVDFDIKNVGKGKISGTAKTDGDFGIKGKFDFDPKLFRKSAASIEVEYNNKDGWSAKGELQIAKDSVKGIKSGNITVGYANNVLEANGTAELTIKGVKEVTLRIKFAEGVSEIEGGVKIEKLPGIKEGEGTLKLIKKGEEYDFSGSGKITPDIPGLTTQLTFEFHNDIFLVDAKVDFEKGRLKGMLNVGITNRAVDTEGKPTGDALPDYKVFGSSELSLKITDKITVSAGVKLLENGEIEVRGGIKLPQKFEVVPKLFSVVEKPLITIPPIHIPLFGIPLGIATIGIEAVIKPRLTADVQIGAGSLTNVQAEIVYNPSQPDDMSITGGADFEFIAEAGITAGVDFGISASIAVASLTGGINLSAFIKAAAQQPVFHADIKYSPKTGFELNGDVKALVKAILGFKGDFYAEASIGVWPADYTKRWEWPIFKKEIDTGLQIGFEFPFGYKDGKADVSFEKLKFSYPSMDDITTKVKEQIVNPIADKF